MRAKQLLPQRPSEFCRPLLGCCELGQCWTELTVEEFKFLVEEEFKLSVEEEFLFLPGLLWCSVPSQLCCAVRMECGMRSVHAGT